MKQILLPLDFEKVSENILKLSFSLAKLIDSDVTILNVTEKKKISEVNFAPLSKKIEQMIEFSELQNVHYQFVLKKGVPEKEIIDYAVSNKVAITVMETRSKEAKQNDLIGSITAEVIDSGKVTVLAIPDDCKVCDFKDFKKIGVAESFKEFDDASYKSFMDLLPDYQFDLNFVHILEKKDDMADYQYVLNQIDSYISKEYSKIKTSYSLIPSEKSISTDLINFFTTSAFDLLIVRSVKRNLVSRLFKASLAKKLVYHAKLPMVVLPIKDCTIENLMTLH